MKAAIITYHRALNYGSVLQSYALNHYLRKIGIESYTIDYSSEGQRNTYTFYEKGHSVMTLVRNLHTFLFRKSLGKKRARFSDFISQKIPLIGTEIFRDKNLQENIDFFICGSDQIWNGNTVDFTSHYLLDFVSEDHKCNSYAPSIGTLQQTDKTKMLFKQHLLRYNNISVREKSGAEYLSNILGRKVETVLDPVFLLDSDEWKTLAEEVPAITEKYILCYYIGDVKGMRSFAHKLAKHFGCKMYVILINLRDRLDMHNIPLYEAGPKEFVNLINNAYCVCTNSFHAMSFSIILKKDFWAFVNDKNIVSTQAHPQTRLLDLAESLGLTDRILDSSSCSSVDVDKKIDYALVSQKLEALKEKSKRYIDNIVNS